MEINLKNVKSIANQGNHKKNSKNKTKHHEAETTANRDITELISVSNKNAKNIKLANLYPSHKGLNAEKSRQNSYNNIAIQTEEYKQLANIQTNNKYTILDKKKTNSKTNTIKNSSNNINTVNEIIIIKASKKNSIKNNNSIGHMNKNLSNTNEINNKKPLIRVQGKYKKKFNRAFSGYKRKNSLNNYYIKNINSNKINHHNKTSSFNKKEIERASEVFKNIIPDNKQPKIIEYSNQILYRDKNSTDTYYYDNNSYNNQYLERVNSNTNINSINNNSINNNSLFNKTGNNFFYNNKIKNKFIKNNINVNDSKHKLIDININDEQNEREQNINIKVKMAFKIPSSTMREKNVHSKDLIMIPLNKKNASKPKSNLSKAILNKYKFHDNNININYKKVKSPSFVISNKIISKNKPVKKNNIATKHRNSELFLSNNINANDNSIISNRVLLNNSIISNINNKVYTDTQNKLLSEMITKYNDEPMTIKEIDDSYNDSTFVISIISNWGNKKQVGITEIEVFDHNNRKIKITECKITGGEGSPTNLLFNNKMHSRNENEMWVCDINKKNSNANINIYLYFYLVDAGRKKNNIWKNINYILIWNFNGWEVNKGIKKIEIYKEDKIFFNGVIPRGEHAIVTYQPYKIKFRKRYIIKRNSSQQKIGRAHV